jgi:mannose-6-phosphate isomerase
MSSPFYPLMFAPVYKTYIWAGHKLARRYKRTIPDGICSESWEVCDRNDGMSIVENGPLAGRTFLSLIKEDPKAWLGSDSPRFPLLIKIIDAGDRLSVQVHPDEKAAKALRAEPKTEMWYSLDSDPGAHLYAGFRPDVTPKAFEAGLKNGNIEPLLESIPAATGSSFFIPAGRIHAIGKGCLLLEVQQNSDTTYRVFDWNRVQPDGTPRALHKDEARQALRWDDSRPTLMPVARNSDTWATLAHCAFFHVSRNNMSKPFEEKTQSAFHILFAESGNAVLGTGNDRLTLPEGRTCLIPAAMQRYRIAPEGRHASVIRIMPGSYIS